MIPTPDELEHTSRAALQQVVDRVCEDVVKELAAKWFPPATNSVCLPVPHGGYPVRLLVEEAFAAKGWQMVYEDDQRDGPFWRVSRRRP